MSDSSEFPTEHLVPPEAVPYGAVPLLVDARGAPRPSAAEEARTLVSRSVVGALATVSDDGSPWASLAMYGLLPDGTPVLCLSTLAEHGRNLHREPRASLLVAAPESGRDPLACGRVTLAGRAERPRGERLEAARAAHASASPLASAYQRFGDFSLWTLEIERVRWVGGYGRMDWTDAESYRRAEPDPIAEHAARAAAHLNEDHADALLAIGRVLGGCPDAVAATCEGLDRYGLDLRLETSRGIATSRVGFDRRVVDAPGLRDATVALARAARAGLG